MAVEMTGRYDGGLKVELQHGPSGAKVHTAAPVDNNGDGSSFSPTDMVAAGLGACMVTIMGILAERDGVDLSGLTFSLEKHMQASPRSIARVPLTLNMPAGIPQDKRQKLEQGALTCPVARSLAEHLSIEAEFVYPD